MLSPDIHSPVPQPSSKALPAALRDSWRIASSSADDLDALRAKWTNLQRRAACSYFQSWGWVGTWLANLTAPHWPHVLEIWRHDRLVGLGLIGNRTIRRHGIIRSNGLFVTETGYPALDCLTVEHNGFLVDRAASAEVVREGILRLAKVDTAWDELFISAVGIDTVDAYMAAARHAELHVLTRLTKPYYFVDCHHIREEGGDYLATLSRNTRYQVRRAMRAYEEQGSIIIDVAPSLQQAEEYFEELREWHQAHWQAKQEPGAFGSSFARDFHRKLVRDRFSAGEIQLVKISAGDAPIGYLYNFVFGSVVYNYQSAFRYSGDARLKPGLVSHCCAIQHNIDAGMHTYDFLMGSQRFKQSLATHQGEMAWLVLQKRRLRFRLEQTAARWREKMLALRRKPIQSGAPSHEE